MSDEKHLKDMSDPALPVRDSRERKPLSCTQCEFTAKNRQGLELHMQAMHPELFPAPASKEAPATAERIIYISRKPTARAVRIGGSVVVQDSMGNASRVPTGKTIRLRFDLTTEGTGAFILDEGTAAAYGLTMAELKLLIENDSYFKTGRVWVGGAAEKAARGPMLQSGVRSGA